MQLIAEAGVRKLWWVPRSEWGSSTATELFILNRHVALPSEKVCLQIHHTAAIDNNDATPNRWDFDEAASYMRKLQTARPDLGPLPYPECPAVAEDGNTVWLFEGRGLAAVGAHTVGHNRHGHAFGVLGNFDKADSVAMAAVVWGMEQRGRMLRQGLYTNLGNEKSPKGWNVWGHRDSAPKSCPGNHLYPFIEPVTLTGPIDLPGGIVTANHTTDPADPISYGEFITAHQVAAPQWWQAGWGDTYKADGGTSDVTTLKRDATRYDLAFMYAVVVKPQLDAIGNRLDALEAGGTGGDIDAAILIHASDPDAHHE